jgi:hypothetical protein
MKSLVRVFLMGGFGAALLSLSAFTTSHAFDAGEISLDSEKVQVVHGSTYKSDTTTMTLTITNHGEFMSDCSDTDDDLIAGGLQEIALSGCSCEEFFWCFWCSTPFNDDIPYFVSHIINHHQYGTFYSSTEPYSSTLSAKATKLATPPMTCGSWLLNLTGTKLNLSSITQSSAMHPIALLIDDGDGSGPFCFDIKDAVVGPVIVH